MIIIQGYLTWILKFLSNKAFLTTTTTSISEKQQQQSQKTKPKIFFFNCCIHTQNKSGENSIGANAFVLVSNISPFLGSVCFVKKKKKSWTTSSLIPRQQFFFSLSLQLYKKKEKKKQSVCAYVCVYACVWLCIHGPEPWDSMADIQCM
jgi:hypothetical protein